MGLLQNGEWQDKWYDTDSNNGKFKREQAQLRDWVLPAKAIENGESGPDGQQAYPAEANRYHLYVSYACPWAHRTLIMRRLKKLEDVISVDVVHPHMLDNGWEFKDGFGVGGDSLYQKKYLHQIYTTHKSDYSGRVTVPVLWDKQRERIVNNESAEIIRMLNSSFNAFTDDDHDYYPDSLAEEIDRVNEQVYQAINNGVYKTGFATEQDAYEEAFKELFDALLEMDHRLATQRFLVGDQLTEADIRFYTTLVRFDPVYFGHFKCNKKRIEDFRNLCGYLRDLYQRPAFRETTNFVHIQQHYYYSHGNINPTRIVPLGPEMHLETPHGREGLA